MAPLRGLLLGSRAVAVLARHGRRLRGPRWRSGCIGARLNSHYAAARLPGARVRAAVRAERRPGRHRPRSRLDRGGSGSALHPAPAAAARPAWSAAHGLGLPTNAVTAAGAAVVATWARGPRADAARCPPIPRRAAQGEPALRLQAVARRRAAADGHHRLRAGAAERRRPDRLGLHVARPRSACTSPPPRP
mgnify:CR=1 FL=1